MKICYPSLTVLCFGSSPEGLETGVGGDGGTVEFQPDFRIELESQLGLFAVTHQVPPGRLRYLKQNAKWMGEL